MLRFLYTVCDLLAGLFAIVSPVAIMHWLAKVVRLVGTASFVEALNPVFDPINAILEIFIKSPPLMFQGEPIPTTQGVLAVLLTVSFFVFNFLSETLKAAEQRLDVTKQSLQQKHRLHQLKAEHQKQQKKASTNRRIQVQVVYDFQACPAGGTHLETTYGKYKGKVLDSTPSGIALQFETLEGAFKYALDASQAILSHYATLRPMDPQPSYQVAVHAVENALPVAEGVANTRKLVGFAGNNQVIFSQDIKAILETQGLFNMYHTQSLGMYAVEGRQQEIFRLFYKKREGAF